MEQKSADLARYILILSIPSRKMHRPCGAATKSIFLILSVSGKGRNYNHLTVDSNAKSRVLHLLRSCNIRALNLVGK